MQRAMQQLSASWKERGLPDIALRVGVHHGPAVVGNFGSEERLDYTAIGHTVNLASRVESACEPGEVFITPEVVDYLPEDVCEERGAFELKGVEGTTRLYRVLPEAAGALKDGEVAA